MSRRPWPRRPTRSSGVVNADRKRRRAPLMSAHFRVGHYEEACHLIKAFHYSRRVPSNVQFIGTWHADGGLVGDFGEPIAACVFSIPPTRWSIPVLELSRLVRHEGECPPLTRLISRCCRELRSAEQ